MIHFSLVYYKKSIMRLVKFNYFNWFVLFVKSFQIELQLFGIVFCVNNNTYPYISFC